MLRRVCFQVLECHVKARPNHICHFSERVLLPVLTPTFAMSTCCSVYPKYTDNVSKNHGFQFKLGFLSHKLFWQNRYYSTFNIDNPGNVNIIESWSKIVDPFGKVTIKGNFNLNIEPADPHEHPEMNMAFVTVYTEKDGEKELTGKEDVLGFNIDLTDQGKHLQISGNGMLSEDAQPINCSIQLPIKFGIQVDMQGNGDVNVSNVESPELNINSKNGKCLLNNIRAGVVKVRTGGSIICRKTLQGNVDIEAKETGAIHADKIQGSHIKLRTDQGDVKVKAVYGDSAIFWTNTGTVRLGSCHGDTTIDVDHHGDVSIDSLDGDLTASIRTDGNMEAYLTRHGKGEINLGRGNLRLSLSDSVYTSVDLKARSIHVDGAFKNTDLKEEQDHKYLSMTGTIGGGVTPGDTLTSSIKATTYKGEITIESCDWFSAMNKSQSWKT